MDEWQEGTVDNIYETPSVRSGTAVLIEEHREHTLKALEGSRLMTDKADYPFEPEIGQHIRYRLVREYWLLEEKAKPYDTLYRVEALDGDKVQVKMVASPYLRDFVEDESIWIKDGASFLKSLDEIGFTPSVGDEICEVDYIEVELVED